MLAEERQARQGKQDGDDTAEAEELPDLDALAKSAGMSRFHSHRIFKDATGLPPKAFAAARRSQRMRDELPKRGTVTEATKSSHLRKL